MDRWHATSWEWRCNRGWAYLRLEHIQSSWCGAMTIYSWNIYIYIWGACNRSGNKWLRELSWLKKLCIWRIKSKVIFSINYDKPGCLILWAKWLRRDVNDTYPLVFLFIITWANIGSINVERRTLHSTTIEFESNTFSISTWNQFIVLKILWLQRSIISLS